MGRPLACVAAGLLLAYGGWRLLKKHEGPVEHTGFHTAPWSSTFGYWGGYARLFLGLYLAVIQASLFWIGRPR